MVVTSVPYLIGFQMERGEWAFTGFVFGVGDGNSYIAKMLQGQAGAWLFSTPYSSQNAPGVLAFLPYLLLGKLAWGDELHSQLVALFHLARLAAIPLLVLAVYRFASLFLPELAWRRWATAVAAIGGGLGWLLVLVGQSQAFGSLPLDFYSPESFGFLAVYGLPHLLLARALLFFALTVYLTPGSGARSALAAGFLLLGLALVQPISLASAYAALAVHVTTRILLRATGKANEPAGPWVRRALVAAAIPLPLLLYYGVGSLTDPALRQWAAQNVLVSPHPVHYVLAYAVLLLPAYLGARDLVRTRPDAGWFLTIWLLALIVLAYVPVTVQRRLIEGAWVVLCILAAAGIRSILVEARRRRVLAGALLATTALTSVLLIAGGLSAVLRPSVPVYRSAAEVAAFAWIADNAAPGSVVLAAFDTGNALPAWAAVRSVIGHGPETSNLADVQPQVERFFGGSLAGPAAERFLREQNVDFVMRGPIERALGPWTALPSATLRRVYDEGGYEIFAVDPDDV
jgi:hypothetical protein